MELSRLTDRISYKLISKKMDFLLNQVKEYERDNQWNTKNIGIPKFGIYNDVVQKFVMKFQKMFTEKQTERMLYNLSSLKITERNTKEKTMAGTISLGQYNSDDNWINMEHFEDSKVQKNQEATLFHELLHMASTKKTNIGMMTGFDIPQIMGVCLNEGYTELLTQRLYPEKENDNQAIRQIFLARGIENLIGQEKMEEYYFNADLNGLIEELEKYAPKKDILKVLFAMDQLSYSLFFNSTQYRALVTEIAKWNATKLNDAYYSDKMTRREYENEYIRKVCEYRKFRNWSESAKILDKDGFFYIQDGDITSDLYEREETENEKKYEKK